MAYLYIITIIFLIVCIVSICFTIIHLYISKKKSKQIFDAIYQNMKILKDEIKEIKKIL